MRQHALHFLHGFRLDLADALGGNAVLAGKLMQRRRLAFGQPAAFDDAPAAFVQLRQGVLPGVVAAELEASGLAASNTFSASARQPRSAPADRANTVRTV